MKLNTFKLDDETLEKMQDLAARTPLYRATGQRIRVGEHGKDNLSVYNYDRWYGWKAKDRNLFKECFPESARDLMLVGHFLEIPDGGHLDRMVAWVGVKQSGYMLSFNIGEEPARIIISDREVEVPVGGSVGFSLIEPHEIPKREGGRDLWACTMLLAAPPTWKAENDFVKSLVDKPSE